jgi:energy-coupling factor transporter ATP-binding protein EcfA2
MQLTRGSVLAEVERYRYKNGISDTLKNLNITINKGEFAGLMGRTGSGKTTTLMLMNGLIPHFFEGSFEGKVIANTMNTRRYHVQTLSRFMGFVMQDPETQIFGITVEKDAAFGPSNLAFGKEKIKELVEKSLKAVGLSGYENRITTELSGGEKQRLAIAGILAMEPEILVLDEPASELDPEGRTEIYKLLADLHKKQGVTILISGHDSEEMLQFTERIIVLDNGTVVWDGEPEKLFANIQLTRQYGIRPPDAAEISHLLAQKNILPREEIFTQNLRFAERMAAKYSFRHDYFIPPVERGRFNSSNIAVEVKDLSFLYSGNKNALKNLNIKINQGEFIALIGKNGAGKTTFSKHLNGLLRPSSWKVFINGRDISGISTSELSREVGYVFQNPDHQIFAATVTDEIDFGLKQMMLPQKEREERIHKALEFVGLEQYKDRHPFMLGKGERQKLAVASILAMEPGILVIDEPTTGQDWDGTQKMMEMLDRLHQLRHTIIAITHNMRLAAEHADRVIVFAHGQVVLDGTPEEVFYENDILGKASVNPPDCAVIGNALRQYGLPGRPVTINDLARHLLLNINGDGNAD